MAETLNEEFTGDSTLVVDTEVDCDLYIKSYVNGIPRYVLFSHGPWRMQNILIFLILAEVFLPDFQAVSQ